ncbi:MAG: ribulose-phosphate 3-epimerase [Candidatus Omnitrophota bacterium]
MGNIKIAPSILSADFSRLKEEISAVEAGGADWIHVDIMDGHFVPNLTIGPVVVKHLRLVTTVPLDVHLMISEPEKYVQEFMDAGSDIITFHIEACGDPKGLIRRIRDSKKKIGISIKPKTPVSAVEPFYSDIDMVLVMTVEPGFGGQSFMEDAAEKIRDVRKRFMGDIEVDGGINEMNAKVVAGFGADVLVAGTSVFRADDYGDAIRRLKGTA